jgi:hypothetical protein
VLRSSIVLIFCQGNAVSHRFRDTFAVELLLAGVAFQFSWDIRACASLKSTTIRGYVRGRNSWRRMFAMLGRLIR